MYCKHVMTLRGEGKRDRRKEQLSFLPLQKARKVIPPLSGLQEMIPLFPVWHGCIQTTNHSVHHCTLPVHMCIRNPVPTKLFKIQVTWIWCVSLGFWPILLAIPVRWTPIDPNVGKEWFDIQTAETHPCLTWKKISKVVCKLIPCPLQVQELLWISSILF